MNPLVNSIRCRAIPIIATCDGAPGVVTHENWCGGSLYSYHAEMDNGSFRLMNRRDWRRADLCIPPVPVGARAWQSRRQSDCRLVRGPNANILVRSTP